MFITLGSERVKEPDWAQGLVKFFASTSWPPNRLHLTEDRPSRHDYLTA